MWELGLVASYLGTDMHWSAEKNPQVPVQQKTYAHHPQRHFSANGDRILAKEHHCLFLVRLNSGIGAKQVP